MGKKNRAKKDSAKKKTSVEAHSSKRLNIRRFLITYVLLMGAFFFIIGFDPIRKVIDLNGIYTAGVIITTAKTLTFLNVPSSFQGSLIKLPSITLDVQFGCNGLEAVMIYSVAVLAYPSAWRRKGFGILAGFLVIQAVNIIRIVGLAYSGTYFRNLFEYIHIYVAQGIMIAVALGVFFIYLSYTQHEARTS